MKTYLKVILIIILIIFLIGGSFIVYTNFIWPNNPRGDSCQSDDDCVCRSLMMDGCGMGGYKWGCVEGTCQEVPIKLWDEEPSPKNPIIIPNTVEIERKGIKRMNLGFYNKGLNTAWAATFVVTECLGKGGVPVTEKPEMVLLSEDVPASTPFGYGVVLREKGLNEGTYLCTIAVVCNQEATTETCSDEPYETKQFFLKVI